MTFSDIMIKNSMIILSLYKNAEIVNINTADVEELKKLKGIGPAMAQRIVDYREANGSFQAPEDIMQVKGIGKAKYAKLKEQIAI